MKTSRPSEVDSVGSSEGQGRILWEIQNQTNESCGESSRCDSRQTKIKVVVYQSEAKPV